MLTIGGKRVDPAAPAPTIAAQSIERVRAVVTAGRIAVIVDGAEVIAGPRTVDNIELIADLLSAYGYPQQAEDLRRGKHL